MFNGFEYDETLIEELLTPMPINIADFKMGDINQHCLKYKYEHVSFIDFETSSTPFDPRIFFKSYPR